jgi:hypothetical protein
MRPRGLSSLALAVACVAASTVGLRFTERKDDDMEIIRGRVGQSVQIRGGEVEVTNVRFGTALAERGEVRDHTNGMFVVVTFQVSNAGNDDLRFTESKLLSHDVTYSRFGISGGPSVAPGFRATNDMAYEVDRGRIDDLTVDLYRPEIIVGYAQHVRISLGITAATADEWRASGRGLVVDLAEDSRRGIW